MKPAKSLSEAISEKLGNWKKFSLKNLRKDQLLILLLSGVLLMVIALPVEKKQKSSSSASGSNAGMERNINEKFSGTDEEAYTAYLEERLDQTLSQIEGAGEVKVMITLKSSTEKVLDKDTESNQETVTEEDSQGGTRQSSKASKKESTVYGNESGSSQENNSPYVSKELSPRIEGVVVIADGGGNAVVKENISSAVQALFDLEPHKIRIMKKQSK